MRRLMKNYFLLIALYSTTIFSDVHAIKCYDCRSENGQCKSNECKIDGGVCSKREKNYGNGTWTVIKGCRGAPAQSGTCEYDQSLAPGGQICFCSDADFCNGAYSTRRCFHIFYYAVILILLYRH